MTINCLSGLVVADLIYTSQNLKAIEISNTNRPMSLTLLIPLISPSSGLDLICLICWIDVMGCAVPIEHPEIHYNMSPIGHPTTFTIKTTISEMRLCQSIK